LIITLVLLAGCGYQSLRQESHSHVDAVNGTNIRLFENRSYRPGLDTSLTTALVDEFAKNSSGNVSDEDNKTQLVLSGVVLSYSSVPVSYTAADKIREYRATIKISTVLQQKKNLEVLWKGELSQEQIFPANADISLQQNSENAAIQELCRKLALDIWRKLHESF
jgi:outer membrane lipopolysaccharide assembly protein LptE/RlpB